MRFLFFLLFLLRTALSVQAQKANIGVYAGPSYSTLHHSGRFWTENQPDLAGRTGWKSGFTAGLDTRIQIERHLGLFAGVQYTEKGDRFVEDLPSGEAAATRFLHYAGMPVSLELELPAGFSVQAGAELYWLLGTGVRSDDSGVPSGAFSEGTFRKIDAGIFASLEYKLGRNLFFRARYTLGVVPLNDIVVPESGSENVHQYNRNFQVVMGYRFQQ